MARKFTDAAALLHDLLDRREGGTEAPFAYPDHAAFPTVIAADAFMKAIAAAKRAGCVALVHGTGRKRDELKLVRLTDADALYAHLGREPSHEMADRARSEMLKDLDVHPAVRDAALAAPDAWSRKRTWCNLGPDDVQAVRTAIMLAQAIVDGRHLGLDYRTFSRKATGNSKALERLEAAVLRLVGAAIDLPPAAGPRAALATLGLERFSPPLLLTGALTLDGTALPLSLPYLGLPPGEIGRIGFNRTPAYVLTIENFASFNRHVLEADHDRTGLTIYVGGYPSLATQRALSAVAAALPGQVPFLHWSDIDPDGTWIFRTVERAIERPLRPHLMGRELAEAYGERPSRASQLRAGEAAGSMISDLVDYLAGPNAKVMEQEEVNPMLPDLSPRAAAQTAAGRRKVVD
ncbi:Wadjet anti-phage system protein JetD domain-containing protein [Microvirga sp. VF16]|uniref:Wadjet anti-phage system protein JetD domain-containing protein n=1 Tax=Microvirga sp. VF16 TaxID=2807101 RepID=UPI00193CFD55|nr:Wadjet anti-phage system protein JetD domain-containing protein [Microvirga sp. VF16]QRM32776.1 hypothetical protein JO965_25710 [Microvirga sp. VF16]